MRFVLAQKSIRLLLGFLRSLLFFWRHSRFLLILLIAFLFFAHVFRS